LHFVYSRALHRSSEAPARTESGEPLSPSRTPFSDGIVAGNTLYVAGQAGTDGSNELATGGIGPETTAALENIQKVLQVAGFELKDIVSVTVYLADIHEFPDMNKIYKNVMPIPSRLERYSGGGPGKQRPN
jgi:enamine deaminase RidA (YjgF/YER057c/UK114 family)